jgi:hypothetical protein
MSRLKNLNIEYYGYGNPAAQCARLLSLLGGRTGGTGVGAFGVG